MKTYTGRRKVHGTAEWAEAASAACVACATHPTHGLRFIVLVSGFLLFHYIYQRIFSDNDLKVWARRETHVWLRHALSYS